MSRIIALLVLQILLFSFPSELAAQEYRRLTNLPHLIIETFNGTSITSKDVYIYSTIFYVDENDSVLRYDSVQIRGRGNSTWNLAKKPYRIKFHEKEKFLGKGYAKAKSWTLLANAADHSLVRNCITFSMGEWLGLKNTPACKFVDLTLNGNYVGNYQISDQVEVRAHRVNIAEQDFPLAPESDITGGYLMEVDGFKDGNCFTTSRYQVPVTVHYPDKDEISSAQNQYIRSYIRNFESVLSSSSFDDPEEGYRPLVDSTSLVNWYIASEVCGNIDAYWSTYFYKDQGDPKLYWGPLWDYDIAYANDNRKGDTSSSLMTEVGYGQTQQWLNRMWDDPWFARLVNRRYSDVVDGGLENYLYSRIDSACSLINESQQLNFQKWNISTRVLREYILYSSYDQYISYIKNYISRHIPYLRRAFAAKKPVEPVTEFVPDANYYYRITAYGAQKALCGIGGLACIYGHDDSEYEQWKIVAVGDYYMIINRESGMALCDPTQGACTATSNTGTQLTVESQDAGNDRQLWIITPQVAGGIYNLTNKYTQHTANLYAGNTADGSKVISYNTDSRNSISSNRLWQITVDEKIGEANAISAIEPEEYALAYNPYEKYLHFGSETPEMLCFNVGVFNASGTRVKVFVADERCYVDGLPSGVYVVRWTVGGRQRSVKLILK